MSNTEIDMSPVTHITTDAIGPPGHRVFYIQGWQEQRTISLIVEKLQIQSLAVGYEQFLAELQQQYPDLDDVSSSYEEAKMRIQPPVDPLFRVGELGLGYDVDNDLVVLVAREIVAEDSDESEARVVRFWCKREQLRAMCRWGMEVAAKGRPTCPQCGEPMDPEGHFCPKKNGHKN